VINLLLTRRYWLRPTLELSAFRKRTLVGVMGLILRFAKLMTRTDTSTNIVNFSQDKLPILRPSIAPLGYDAGRGAQPMMAPLVDDAIRTDWRRHSGHYCLAGLGPRCP
jgi:hypothetical protein